MAFAAWEEGGSGVGLGVVDGFVEVLVVVEGEGLEGAVGEVASGDPRRRESPSLG